MTKSSWKSTRLFAAMQMQRFQLSWNCSAAYDNAQPYSIVPSVSERQRQWRVSPTPDDGKMGTCKTVEGDGLMFGK